MCRLQRGDAIFVTISGSVAETDSARVFSTNQLRNILHYSVLVRAHMALARVKPLWIIPRTEPPVDIFFCSILRPVLLYPTTESTHLDTSWLHNNCLFEMSEFGRQAKFSEKPAGVGP